MIRESFFGQRPIFNDNFDSYNPTWMETKFILAKSLTENLCLRLYDYNDHRKNALLGTATFPLEKLVEEAIHENVAAPILMNGKERGELRFDVSYYPVIKPEAGQEEILDSSLSLTLRASTMVD